MFLVGEANFLAGGNTGFLINSSHKAAAVIASYFGRGGFRYSVGRVQLRRYDSDYRGGGDRWGRTS